MLKVIIILVLVSALFFGAKDLLEDQQDLGGAKVRTKIYEAKATQDRKLTKKANNFKTRALKKTGPACGVECVDSLGDSL